MPSLNPFSSNSIINAHRNSLQSSRPPTYTTLATAAPTYTPDEPVSPSARVRSERVRAWSESLHNASSQATQDSDTVIGQSESSLTDTASIAETSAEMTRPLGPRYVYYRTYSSDGPIRTKNTVYSDDPYLGRIPAQHVTPPHIVINLKHNLSGAENINENITTSLFISASSQTPMDDNGRVSILTYPGPGCTPREPMALVAIISSSSLEARAPQAADHLPSNEGTTPIETQYIYYRVYNKRGIVLSKQPADSNDPYVGRISVDHIPPPHTAVSVMRCISRIEELDNTWQSQLLFSSTSSESSISEVEHVPIFSSDRPGSTPEDPMAIVSESTKRIRVFKAAGYHNADANWLPTTMGEILGTSNASTSTIYQSQFSNFSSCL